MVCRNNFRADGLLCEWRRPSFGVADAIRIFIEKPYQNLLIMRIEAHKENPIIRNSDDYFELKRRVEEVDPTIYSLFILPRNVVIVRIGRRSFRYGAHPSIEWIVSKVRYMKEHDI